jgi:hypothetical protein
MKTKKVILTAVLLISTLMSFSQNLSPFKRENGKFGFKDSTGNIVVEAKYDDAESFSEGLAAVSLNNKWGFINKEGKEVIPLKYDMVNWFENGKARVKIDGEKFYIKTKGERIE